jgi:hypothetical protein
LTLTKTVAAATLASSITIVPVSLDDWQVLELNLEVVQETLLNQVRVVYAGQELPVWLDERMHVFLRVESVEPKCPFARINGLTRVNVKEAGEWKEERRKEEGSEEEWTCCMEVDDGRGEGRSELRRCCSLTTVDVNEATCRDLGLANLKGKALIFVEYCVAMLRKVFFKNQNLNCTVNFRWIEIHWTNTGLF